MEEQIKFNTNMQITMANLHNDIKSVCKTIEESNSRNNEEHHQIIYRLARIEKFAIGILVIFALAALYLIFRNSGLPVP